MLNKLARELAVEIFVADGGVDDFREMTDAELLLIARERIPVILADLVVVSAKKLED